MTSEPNPAQTTDAARARKAAEGAAEVHDENGGGSPAESSTMRAARALVKPGEYVFRSPETSKPFLYRFIQFLFRSFFALLFRTKATGLERLPATGPFLLLPNHASFLDPPLIGAFVKREIHFMCRENLLTIPVIGWALRNVNGHGIRREGIDRAALKVCAAAMKAGWPVLVFPEGTRSPDGKLQEPKAGFGMLIDEVPGMTCVPAMIRGAAEALPRGAILPKPRLIELAIGEPWVIEPRRADEPRRVFLDRCVEELMAHWRKLQAEMGDPPV